MIKEKELMITDVVFEIMWGMITRRFGIDEKTLKKILLNKGKDSKDSDLSENFNIIQEKLTDSQRIIESVLIEVEEQKKIFEQKKREAEISENVKKLNQKELESVRALLDESISKESKKSNINNIVYGAIFCVLSALLGFALGKL
jgi:hypothetical protein